MRTKECEVQLSLARAEEQRKRAEDEMKKSRTLSSQVSTFSQTETELRSQLNIYVEKFKQAGLSLPRLLAAVSLCLPFLSPPDFNMPPANMLWFPDLSCITAAAGGHMVYLITLLQPSAVSYPLSNLCTPGRRNSQQLQRAIPDLSQGNGGDV